MTKSITLERIKNIVKDIKVDNEGRRFDMWEINDSHSQSHYDGICLGLNMLVNHLEELERESND